MICWKLHSRFIESVHIIKLNRKKWHRWRWYFKEDPAPRWKTFREYHMFRFSVIAVQEIADIHPCDFWHCTAAAVHSVRHHSYCVRHQSESASSSSLIDYFVVWYRAEERYRINYYIMPRGTVSYDAVSLGNQGHGEAGVSPGSSNYDVILNRRQDWWWKPGPIDS